MQECLYDGEWPKDSPHALNCFCSCFCGDKIYFFGTRTLVIYLPDDPTLHIHNLPCLSEFSIDTGKAISYVMDEDLPGETVDIYTLTEDLLGVVFSSQQPDRITQQIWKLNRKSQTVDCVFERKMAFTGVYNCRLGIGTIDTGYIQLLGKSSIENGDALVTKIIAANPMQSAKCPDISFDKEVAKLEQLCKNHPNELMLFPNCVPLIDKSGIYFLLGRVREDTLIFETELIGCIKNAKGKPIVEIIPVDGIDAMKSVKKAINRELNVGWCSHISQRVSTAWMSFVVFKPSSHWRFKLQYIAILACSLVIRYIGKPLVWFSKFDGGFLATQFARLYIAVVGNSLIPNLGPSPDLLLLSLDLQHLRFRHVDFKGNERIFRTLSSAIMVDADAYGNLISIEASPQIGRMRICRIPNPFRIPKLLEIAFKVCQEFYPSSCSNLHNVSTFGGCTLFL